MEKLGGKNPCDICKKDDCWECLLNSWSKKYYQCLTYECFLNYEGSCLISLYESCGACKGE